MRLLSIDALKFAEFYGAEIPPYAIASHRWGSGEPTYKDVLKERKQDLPGFQKIRNFCFFLSRFDPSIKWLWIDTCCIDKTSSAELSEAINSMYRWYRRAAYCVAYLADYPADFGLGQSSFASRMGLTDSVWFTRGWTLQELIAPKTVIFVDRSWSIVGYKSPCPQQNKLAAYRDLTHELAGVTGIPASVLLHETKVRDVSIDERLGWMSNRRTQRVEDMAYCLLGLFDVSMPLIYGEGEKAWTRLLDEIEANSKRARPKRKRKRLPEDAGSDNRRRLEYRAITRRNYAELLNDNASVASTEVREVKPNDIFQQIWHFYRRTLSQVPCPERLGNLTARITGLHASDVRLVRPFTHRPWHRTIGPPPSVSAITEQYWGDSASRDGLLRQFVCPLWKDAAAASIIWDNDDDCDQDLLELQMWKVFHRGIDRITNSERLSNMLWRMGPCRRVKSNVGAPGSSPNVEAMPEPQTTAEERQTGKPVVFERELNFSDSD